MADDPPEAGLEHLSEASRAWVERVRVGWHVEAHHNRVLMVAAEAFDQAERMRRVLDSATWRG